MKMLNTAIALTIRLLNCGTLYPEVLQRAELSQN